MRIVSGKLGGRQFASPRGYRTHPMSEKMRGALFSSLGNIEGATVLDTYSGSGALSFEAVSRGASQVVAVEHDINGYRTIVNNVNDLAISEKISVFRANVKSWSNNNKDKLFDIVLADPPYDDIRPDIIEKISRHLDEGGVFVVSWPGKEKPRELLGLQIIKNNSYGDSQLVFYTKTG